MDNFLSPCLQVPIKEAPRRLSTHISMRVVYKGQTSKTSCTSIQYTSKQSSWATTSFRSLRIKGYLASTAGKGAALRKTKKNQKWERCTQMHHMEGRKKGRRAEHQYLTLTGQLTMRISRRQETSAQSITEAKYIAWSEGAKDVWWMHQFLSRGPNLPTCNTNHIRRQRSSYKANQDAEISSTHQTHRAQSTIMNEKW